MDKSPDAFRTISEAAEDLDLPQHVLRFWETRFPQIKPLKRGGGRRYYRPDDVELLRVIKQLLYGEGYTIKGVQKLFKEQGARSVAAAKQTHAASDADASLSSPGPAEFVGRPRDDDDESDGPGDRIAAANPRAALSPADLQALRAALADLSEGERILALARGV
jgi:DNA-binding transcriptional MerR regulator